MGLFRFDYWTQRLTIIIALLLFFSGWLLLEETRDYLLWIAVSYLLAIFIYPYFKKYFFSKTVIFDFVGVVNIGTMEDYYMGNIFVRPGMRELIERLKVNNKVVLFSNNPWEAHQVFSKKLGLDSLFDFQYTSGSIKHRKPFAEAYRIILGNINSRPGASVMVDDRTDYLTGASEIGMHTILFKDMEQLMADLRALGYRF
ncbi:MAG: HAD-IA family hydrolase [Candidatus Micrarchaeota archaeon]